MSAPAIESTAQKFLEIYDITNDLVIMKDGATALILTVNAMNFGLLAEEEQDAIIYAYAGLLNSLNYPIQIIIRSQTKDITNYLNLLKDQEDQATDELKRNAIKHYREFVGELIKERNILDKKFYVAIPASALEMGLMPPQTVLPGVKQIDISSVERSLILDKAKDILEPKRDHLIGQFSRIGLYARQLDTQEIIQLFYTSYNPEATEGQQLTDTNNYTTPLVAAQMRQQFLSSIPVEAAMTDAQATPNTNPVSPTTSSTPDVSTLPTTDTLPAAAVTPDPTLAAPATPSIDPMNNPVVAPADSPAPAVLADTPIEPTLTPAAAPMNSTDSLSSTPAMATVFESSSSSTSSNPMTPPTPPAAPMAPSAPTPTDTVSAPSTLGTLPQAGDIEPLASPTAMPAAPASISPSPLAGSSAPSTPSNPTGPSSTPPAQNSGAAVTPANNDALPPLPEI